MNKQDKWICREKEALTGMGGRKQTVEIRIIRTHQAVVAHMLMPALGRHRQADLWELEASLLCRGSSRIGSKSHTEKCCLGKPKRKHNQKHM